MDLGNSFEVVVRCLLIGGMISLDHRDEFPMMSALVCMVTHWIGPMVNYDIRLLGTHNFTKLCCIVLFLNLARILSLCRS